MSNCHYPNETQEVSQGYGRGLRPNDMPLLWALGLAVVVAARALHVLPSPWAWFAAFVVSAASLISWTGWTALEAAQPDYGRVCDVAEAE